jgi:hypothetical protein
MKPQSQDMVVKLINEQALMVIVLSVIYSTFVALYLVFVHLGYSNSYFGYMNPQAFPGTAVFVDRRISYYWVLSVIFLSRLVLAIIAFLAADYTKYSGWLFSLHRRLSVFYIIVDIVYLCSLLFFGGNCNSILFPNNPCNSPSICSVYGDTLTTLCRNDSFTGASLASLIPNGVYTFDSIVAVAFLVLDILQQGFVKSMKKTIKRYYL